MPMVRRRRLAAELRRRREAAGLTCEEVAARLDCSGSKISRIETGRVLVSPRDVRDLTVIYGLTGEQCDSLIQLAREARQKGWWQGYGDSVEPALATFLGMQSSASVIRQYATARVPVLLQTEDYARAVIRGGLVGTPRYAGTSDRVVEMLMENQRLAAASMLEDWVVIDEAALRRQVGGREVMRAQISHLIDFASSHKTTFFQLFPLSSDAQVAMGLPFVILGFADPADPDVVAIGYPTGVLWVEDLGEVDRYNLYFRHLQAAAMSFSDSVALMTTVLEEM